MNSNIGGDDIPRGTVSLKDDMEAFDALPRDLRKQLSNMSVNWNAVGVRDIGRAYGTGVAMTVLRKTEADMQAAYRVRTAA